MPRTVFVRPCLIGAVHLAALPGAPRARAPVGGAAGGIDPLADCLAAAIQDAHTLVANGCDALIVENFGDVPFYPTRVPPETIAAMARAIAGVIAVAGGRPVGVNVLRNDARAAIGLCAATGASFVRVNVHAGAAVTDQGIVEGRAFETLRERERLAPNVAILADAHVKHATPLSRESLAECVADLVLRALCDGVIVSGTATGSPPALERVREACGAVRDSRGEVRDSRGASHDVPVLIGSGLDEDNARALLEHASGAIVGTSLKVDGLVSNPVDASRVRRMRALFDAV